MAIDFGRKRCGIAVTDSLKIVANGLPTISTANLVDFVKKYVSEQSVDSIIVGEPKNMRGEESESMRYIRPVLNRLKKELPSIPILMWDERFTSVLAHKGMLESGMKRSDRQCRETADEMAAVIILNSYLDSKKFKEQ